MKSTLSYIPLATGLLVLVLSLAVGVLTVNSKRTSQNVTSKATLEEASLSLSPSVGDYIFSTTTSYPIGIVLDTSGKSVDGVDVIINFDPNKVMVVGTTVTPTNVFESVVLNQVDNTKGVIKFSALTFNAKPVTGVIGTFQFRPRSVGNVSFSFAFTKGFTIDSNVAEHGTANDILSSVVDAQFSFK